MDHQGARPARPNHGIDLMAGQPIVAIDYDGVVNIIPIGEIPAGFSRQKVELDRANWPEHPYIRPLPFGRRKLLHEVVVSPEHGRMVREWQAAGAAVVWATTWERAVLRNAALSAIPDLPVLEISKVIPGVFPQRTADWKMHGLSVAFQGHPLVWVDDFATDLVDSVEYGDPPAPLLVVAPDATVGLTERDSAAILSFLRRHA